MKKIKAKKAASLLPQADLRPTEDPTKNPQKPRTPTPPHTPIKKEKFEKIIKQIKTNRNPFSTITPMLFVTARYFVHDPIWIYATIVFPSVLFVLVAGWVPPPPRVKDTAAAVGG